jgi:hypothetical protein
MLASLPLLPACAVNPELRSDEVLVGSLPSTPLPQVRHLTVIFEPLGLEIAQKAGNLATTRSGWGHAEKMKNLRERVLAVLAHNGIPAEVLAGERAGRSPTPEERGAAYVLRVVPSALGLTYQGVSLTFVHVGVRGSVHKLGTSASLLRVGGGITMDLGLPLRVDAYLVSVLNAMADHKAPPLPLPPVRLP